MLHNQKFVMRIIILLMIALTNLMLAVPAIATTENLQFESDRGYRVETNFSYDQAETKNKLDSLKVRFYNPDGEMMASYDNIVEGKVLGNYFEFNYDQDAHQPLGEIDLGGESAGEIYLKGSTEQGFSLIEVKQTGEEMIVDSGQWILSK